MFTDVGQVPDRRLRCLGCLRKSCAGQGALVRGLALALAPNGGF